MSVTRQSKKFTEEFFGLPKKTQITCHIIYLDTVNVMAW